jgi:hypothetical protein
MASLFKSIEIVSKYIKQNIIKSYTNKIISENYYNKLQNKDENIKCNDVKKYEEILTIKYALGLTQFDETKTIDKVENNKENKENKENNKIISNTPIRIADNPFCCNECGNCSY